MPVTKGSTNMVMDKYEVIDNEIPPLFLCKNKESQRHAVFVFDGTTLEDLSSFDYKYLELHKVHDPKKNEGIAIAFKPQATLETIEQLYGFIKTVSKVATFKEFADNAALFIKSAQKGDFLAQYKKLRGDFGEALYIHRYGGKRVYPDNMSFDIIHDGDEVEVKTYAIPKRTIEITHQQLSENTRKYAVGVESDNNGLSILELAKKIEGKDPDFADQLLERWTGKPISEIRMKDNAPKEITSDLKSIKIYEFPEIVVDCNYEIKIKK